jgi:hypothetical protein
MEIETEGSKYMLIILHLKNPAKVNERRGLRTPYSRIPLPHHPQNSRRSTTPDPLSASWMRKQSGPLVILKEERGIFVVVPKGDPVNF